jgi:hypothetical protein
MIGIADVTAYDGVLFGKARVMLLKRLRLGPPRWWLGLVGDLTLG